MKVYKRKKIYNVSIYYGPKDDNYKCTLYDDEVIKKLFRDLEEGKGIFCSISNPLMIAGKCVRNHIIPIKNINEIFIETVFESEE